MMFVADQVVQIYVREVLGLQDMWRNGRNWYLRTTKVQISKSTFSLDFRTVLFSELVSDVPPT